jgi:hypothetical protein
MVQAVTPIPFIIFASVIIFLAIALRGDAPQEMSTND